MKQLIKIQDLSKKKASKNILNHLNLEIQKGEFLTILGPNGSGKTTLASCLLDYNQYKDHILYSKANIKIEYLSSNSSFQYDHVLSELKSYYKKKKTSKKLEDLIQYFHIESLLENTISHLSENEKKIVFFIRSCCIQPDILILDDFLTTMESKTKQLIFNYLYTINQQEKTTVIHFTSSSEDCLYGSMLAILNQGKILIHDSKQEVLKTDKIFKENNLVYPFLADLSLKLQYYNVLDKIILDSKELVNAIWK